MRSFSGFSLIELLVAMAIMSMTLLISSTGYSFYMDRWQKELGSFDASANIAKKLMLTKQLVTGIFPYILRDSNNKAAIYFEGNEDGFIAVTTKSFFKKNAPYVVRFSIEQNTDFTFNLIVESVNIELTPVTSIIQELAFSNKLVLLENLSDVKFSYLGNKDLAAKNDNKQALWWQSFNALNRQILPDVIKISFIYQDTEEELNFPVSQVDLRTLALFNEL